MTPPPITRTSSSASALVLASSAASACRRESAVSLVDAIRLPLSSLGAAARRGTIAPTVRSQRRAHARPGCASGNRRACTGVSGAEAHAPDHHAANARATVVHERAEWG
ncbi:Uncharacterised protein [Mycobacteroides abscessus]|nr:Uncharacterised protein [Mycobacteroides abscessus]